MIRSKCRFIIENYFLLICINALVMLLTKKGYIISILFPTTLIYYTLTITKKKRTNFYDIIIGFIFFWILITWLFNSYNYKTELIFRCILGQVTFMMTYYIGRNESYNFTNKILQNALLPLSICGIIGIIWYFHPPQWYLNKTLSTLEDLQVSNSIGMVLELSRLRSIFSSPYEIAYMCALCNIFLLFRIYQAQEKNKRNNVYFIIFIITMLFCMMRAPISCVIMSFLIGLFYNSIYHGKIKMLIVTFVVILFISSLIYAIFQSLDPTISDFITSKFTSVTDDSDDLINNRVNLWDYTYNLLGDGAGRHAIYADDYNPQTSIRDSEYIKILVEQGYIGLYLHILLLFLLAIKCIRYFKYLAPELCILLFYCITMIGANSLTTPDKHCFIFWLIAGKIASFTKKHPNNIFSSLQQNEKIRN